MIESQILEQAVLDKLKQIGGDKLVSELIGMFLELAPGKIAEVATGAQTGDMETVERAAHSLKSSAGNLGAVALQELCARIEALAENNRAEQVIPLVSPLQEAYDRLQPQLEELSRGAA